MLVKTSTLSTSIFKNRGFILFQYIVPQHLLSWFFGKLANCRIVWVKNYLIRTFLKRYQVKMQEAMQSDPYRYANFQSFFIRALQTEKRPIARDINGFVSPVDGTLSQMAKIVQGSLIQAKGFEFSLLELLGNQSSADLFENGTFMTLYLAPKDYHRVHFPVNAKLVSMTYIPGCLFSVNQQTTHAVPRLFSRNERVVCLFETAKGPMSIILVGAMIVGSIHTTWAGAVKTYPRKINTWNYIDSNLTFKKGAELGYFTVGSTVIMLMGPDYIQWNKNLCEQKDVKVGELLGLV